MLLIGKVLLNVLVGFNVENESAFVQTALYDMKY